jgi:hypothetical protein
MLDVVGDSKSKLYRYENKGSEWKERGVGNLKLLEHKETHKIRLLFRQEKTLKIRANHIGAPGMSPPSSLALHYILLHITYHTYYILHSITYCILFYSMLLHTYTYYYIYITYISHDYYYDVLHIALHMWHPWGPQAIGRAVCQDRFYHQSCGISGPPQAHNM